MSTHLSYFHAGVVASDTVHSAFRIRGSCHPQCNVGHANASGLRSSTLRNLSFELDGMDVMRSQSNLNVTGGPRVVRTPSVLVVDHLNSASDVYSLTDFNVKERAKQSVPRKVPTRFWNQKPLPEDVDIGQELGDQSPVWERYQTEAKEYDKTLSDGWTGDMDVLLVFAALFSAILTAFIIEFYQQLQPDPSSTSLALSLSSNMIILLHCIANHTACVNIPSLPLASASSTQASNAYRWINALWFASLTISLLVSAVAILAKQWVHAYHSGLNGNPRLYSHLRQYRYNGIESWHMSGVIRALPSLMYFAVILFFAGLLVLLANLDSTIYYICLTICIVAGFAYILTLVSPMIDPSCPFRTPASQFLDRAYQILSFYAQRICLYCVRQVLLLIMSTWHWITAVYSQDTFRRSNSMLLKTLDAIESHLFRHPTFVPIAQKEMEAIDSQIPELAVDALVWLSNTNVLDTQDIVVQAISGISLDGTSTKFHKFHKSLKLKRSPSSFLIDAYHNPSSHSSHHHKLANYAQAYLMTLSNCPELSLAHDAIESVRNALQWYPSLTALSTMAGDLSKFSGELLSQAIKELGEGLLIVTNLSSNSVQVQEWEICSQMIIDLVLQSILLVCLFFEDSSIQSQIIDSSFETLQIWMVSQAVLDLQPRPVYLLSLCSLVQLFSGITSSSQLYQCWFSKDRHKDTWTLLLRSLVTLPETEDREDFPSLYPEEFLTDGLVEFELTSSASQPVLPAPFRHWRLLRCVLQDCTLLSDDTATFNLVLDLFLKTNPESPGFWTKNKNPFRCLHLIGPLFTPEDTIRVLNFFRASLQGYTSTRLCQFLQARCQDLAHAEAIFGSAIFESMIDDLLFTADFSALWLFATILQTLSHNDSLVSNRPILSRLLTSIHAALTEKIEREDPQTLWDYYTHWYLPFNLASSCRRLYLTYNISTSETGIIDVLRRLSIILAISDFRERKEARNFINTMLRLEEWENVH